MKKNCKLLEVLLLFILSLTPLLWLRDGYVILGHDSGFRLNPLQHLGNLFYSWDPSSNFGWDWSLLKGFLITQAPETLFVTLTGSLSFGQTLTFIFWFFLIGFSMYVFINAFFSDKKYWIFRIFGSTFYMYNFFLLQAWFIVERAKFSLFIALPLGLLVIYKSLTREYSLQKGVILFSLLLFFFNMGGYPTFFGALLLAYGATFIYLTAVNIWRKGQREIIYSLKLGLFFIIGFLAINAYWVLPQLYFASNSFSSKLQSSGGIEGILGWESSISRNASFINIFRLEGIPDWYNNINHPYANNYISNPFLIVLSFFPLFIILWFLVKSKYQSKDGVKFKLFYLLFFLFLLSFLFTAGSHPPLGFIYATFIKTIPGFAIFRSAFYKFGPVFWFSYIFLIGLCLNMILLSFYKKRLLYIFFGLLTVLIVLLYHYPFFTTNFFVWNLPFSTKVKVPNYVYQIADYINHTSSSRIILLPELDSQFHEDAYAWGFWSLDLLPRLFTNRSIIANTDNSPAIIDPIYETISKRDEELFLRLAGMVGIDRVLWRDDILFSDKKTDASFFTAIKKRLESFNGVKLEKQMGFWTLYKVESPYYLPLFYIPDKLTFSYSSPSLIQRILNKKDQKIKRTFLFADNLINKNREITSLADENLIVADCILCEVGKLKGMEDEIKIPYVKLLPDSPFYFLIFSKEQNVLNTYKNSPPQKIDADLSFANKRLAELDQVANRDFKKDNSEYLMQEGIKKYKFLINDALDQSLKLPKEIKNPILIKILAYVKAQYKYFGMMNNKHGLAEDDLEDLSVFMQENINRLVDKEIWMTSFPDNQIKYTFNIEKPGNYDLHIEATETQPKKILINNQESANFTNYYLSSGLHKLNLIYPVPENTLKTYEATDSGELTLDFGKKIRFGIKNYQDKNTYIINFDYKIFSGRPNFSITEEEKSGKKIKRLKLEQNRIWNNFGYLFKPKEGSKQVYLQFAPSGFDLGGAVIQIKNFTIIKNFVPEVFLSNSSQLPLGQSPRLAFQKINPTSYLLHIKDANSPYILSFGEAYNYGWKAYILKNNYRTNQLNTFFIPSINERNHYELNGYANGWLIDQKGNYDIIVEYFPQKIFYLGLIISVVTLFSFASSILVRSKNEGN